MRNKKRLKAIIFSLILFVSFCFTINITTATPKNNQKIYDFAGILTPEQIKELEATSNKYGAKRETDIIILTTNDTNDKDIVKYMEDFYDEKALGYDKLHGNCAILTIDMQHRELYLAGFYKAKEYLDDSRLDLMRDKITPDLTKKDYYKSCNDFIMLSYKYMGIRPGLNPDNIVLKLWFQIIISLSIAGIVVGTMVYNSGGKITVNESTYRDDNSSEVIEARDDYIRTSITKVKVSSNNNSSGGSSGGSFGGGGGTSSGGNSHSGSGGSF